MRDKLIPSRMSVREIALPARASGVHIERRGWTVRFARPLCLSTLLMTLAWSSFPAAGTASGIASPQPFSRLDSLFLAAATGAPRLQALRDSCERELVAGGRATLEYLAAQRFGNQTPRQQHYVERLFTRVSDSGRAAASREVLAAALSRPGVPDSVRALMLYVGSAIGDTGFRAVALPWLDAPSPVLRRMALRSLGQYPHPDNPAILRAMLGAAQALERHQVLWALDRQKERAPLALLVPVLNDPWFYNRQKARDLLLKGADSSWAKLAPLLPPSFAAQAKPSKTPQAKRRNAQGDGARDLKREEIEEARLRGEWRLLARDAKGGDAWLRDERLHMTAAERIFFGVEKSKL